MSLRLFFDARGLLDSRYEFKFTGMFESDRKVEFETVELVFWLRNRSFCWTASDLGFELDE